MKPPWAIGAPNQEPVPIWLPSGATWCILAIVAGIRLSQPYPFAYASRFRINPALAKVPMPCQPLLAGATSGAAASDSFSFRVLLMSSKVALVRFTLSFGYFAVKAALTAVTHCDCMDALSVQVSSVVMVVSGSDAGSVFTSDGAVDSAGADPPGAQPAIGMVTAAAVRPRKVRRLVIMVSPGQAAAGGFGT